MLRDFLDDILSFIDSESLTDDEFGTVPEDTAEDYTKPAYDALKAVLQEREGVSGQLKKLKSYFVAKGVDLSATLSRDASSHILIGVALD